MRKQIGLVVRNLGHVDTRRLALVLISGILVVGVIITLGLLICSRTGAEGDLSILQRHLRHVKIIDRRDKPLPDITPDQYDDEGQAEAILEFFKRKKHGTFIEAGANDGFHHANTLPLEMEHSWRGLLVEPVPDMFTKLKRSGRSAALLHGCLSPYSFPYIATMQRVVEGYGWDGAAYLDDPKVADPSVTHNSSLPYTSFTIDCYPLYDVMKAAGLTKVDVLSLDVQGPELRILETLPWDLVDIKLIQIENNYIHFKDTRGEQRFRAEAVKLLEPLGYTLYKKISLDYLFVKKTFKLW